MSKKAESRESTDKNVTSEHESILSKEDTMLFSERSAIKGSALFLLNVSLFFGTIYGALYFEQIGIKLIFSALAGLFMTMLVALGHDACHQSLTPYRSLNFLIGQLSFLPALHPYSLWDLEHNRIHHRYTNLKTKDNLWVPCSKQEYERLPLSRRLAYRFYRSLFGMLFYYPIEIWWKKLFLPNRKQMGDYKGTYIRDTLIVAVYLLILLYFLISPPSSLVDSLQLAHLARWDPLIYAFILPFLFSNFIISFVIYLQHTHPEISWFENQEDWDARRVQLEQSVHVIFPGPINFLFHRIMEHTAHHVRPSIPLYRLKKAQDKLEELHGDKIVRFKWSLRKHVEIISKCKLYDFESYRWLDFSGKPTTQAKI